MRLAADSEDLGHALERLSAPARASRRSLPWRPAGLAVLLAVASCVAWAMAAATTLHDGHPPAPARTAVPMRCEPLCWTPRIRGRIGGGHTDVQPYVIHYTVNTRG